MNKDKKKNNRKNLQGSNEKYVTLPYDFLPFPSKWHPYAGKGELSEWSLPRHDRRDQLSGYIQYKLRPQSDLAVEIKEGKDGRLFLGGSQMRGRVRTNLEILSWSYPRFIATPPMLFRDFTGDLKSSYQGKMNIANGIERSIQAGFLKQDDDGFYVVPAQKYFADKYFASIKEHRLINVGFKRAGTFAWLYDQGTSKKQFEKINEIQKQIDILTDEIKKLREQLQDDLALIQDSINNLFIKNFNFTTSGRLTYIRNQVKRNVEYDYGKYLEEMGGELLTELNQLRTEDDKLKDFFMKMAERWILKAEVDINYLKLSKNRPFYPYQIPVYYSQNTNGGIDSITSDATKDVNLKGYIFNSTNAGSKRSHYFIKEEEKGKIGFAVPPAVIQSYRQNYKKSKNQEKIKDFYNIFDNYQTLLKDNPEGPIVFFQTRKDGKVEKIGRTPYFKIPYNHSIGDILQEKGENNKIGYADALFGFTPDIFESTGPEKENENDEKTTGYKSRLRFSPLDIKGKFDRNRQYVSEQILLPSPFASASAMYLRQTENKKTLSTYEDQKIPRLNGYKYYHILDKVQKSKEEPVNMISTKGVMKHNEHDRFHLEGKIYFHNLAHEELGLLLLSLDVKEVLQSQQYVDFIEENRHLIQNACEQIGGAKPYGYGKVKVEIDNLYLEKRDCSFESLILDPLEEKTDRYEYIDAFIHEMYAEGQEAYFRDFKNYIESKQERNREEKAGENYSRESPTTINWNNLSEKIRGGYPKEWRLWRKE